MRRELPGCCLHALREVYPASPGSGLGPADAAELAAHLYICQGLSTYQIGQAAGIDRQRVARLLARRGVPVKARGAGRPRRRDHASAALDDVVASLYVKSRWSSAQISALTGIPQRTIRDRLRASGVRMRTRGLPNREDRASVPEDELIRLYVAAGLSAAETGRLLGVSGQIVLRAAHDQGLPVRAGGRGSCSGPAEIELIDALYADPLVRQALSRHGIPRRPAGGPIWQRFPAPVPVSPQLAGELYTGCGLGARHIELLTGQPAQTMLRLLQASGIARRPAGGRTPFMRRWNAARRSAVTGVQGSRGTAVPREP